MWFFSYFRLSRVQLFESDPIGHLVALIVADDKDGDKLFFSITDGDDAKDFYINPDQGNLVVASKLNFSRKKLYNLTIEITDGRQQTHANVIIDILPMITKRPQFKQQITKVITNYKLSKNLKEVPWQVPQASSLAVKSKPGGLSRWN